MYPLKYAVFPLYLLVLAPQGKKKKKQFYSCIRQMLTTVTPTEGATKKWEYSPQPTTNLVYNKVSQIFTLLFFFFFPALLWVPDNLKHSVDKSCVSSRHVTVALLPLLAAFTALPLLPRSPYGPHSWQICIFDAYYLLVCDAQGASNAGGPVCYLTYFPEAQEHQVTCTRSPMSQ